MTDVTDGNLDVRLVLTI